MKKFHLLLAEFFDKIVLERPRLILLCLLAVVSFLGYKAKDFRLDASTETLILETDQDLQYSQVIKSRYGGHDYLLLTYTPQKDLFSDEVLAKLASLRNELKRLKNVSSVFSILDAPLLESPPVPVRELATRIQTLESSTVDRKLAKIEFSSSPLYNKLLVSPDLKTTALQINFKTDAHYQDLLARHDHLLKKKLDGFLTAGETDEFKKLSEQVQSLRNDQRNKRHQDIAEIRAIMDKYNQDAELFLGGISMVADDLIRFIKSDLKIFGLGVLLFLIISLSIIFRNSRWVILPILCCAVSGIAMLGILGMFGWPVTVISSNFISLQLIITMALTIHLIIRYRDLALNNPGADQRALIRDTISLMLTPCLYAALTTIAGFGSLVFCEILPVKTFGWMMIAGIVVSYCLTFLLYPAGLMLMRKKTPQSKPKSQYSLTSLLAGFTEKHGITILVSSSIVFAVSVLGIFRLTVENSFIDYFKDTTEIHRGMKVIDRKLGGTTPLDVIIDIDQSSTAADRGKSGSDKKNENETDEFEAFDEFESTEENEKYWFTSDKMAQVAEIHDYLDGLPETGKVISLGTMLKIAEKLNGDRPLDNFQLALLYKELPEKFKSLVLNPYVSVEHNQFRFSIRVRDSEKSLKRDVLLKKIRNDLVDKLGLKEENVHLAGMLVLYNNMLQSLFGSQVLTLGAVVLALMGMFLILFKSIKIALIAIAPNLLSTAAVLGFMGWMNIPLDMMTITIAAISIGIAVDNTIHYIYRFKHEFTDKRDYIQTVHHCHGSIGYAMYYTSVTIIIGFSILALSNFLPSIYFGLLTGLAMLIALFAALTLLPQLLIVFKPFGPEAAGNST
jgi:predicted RND superfamily exporter protein